MGVNESKNNKNNNNKNVMTKEQILSQWKGNYPLGTPIIDLPKHIMGTNIEEEFKIIELLEEPVPEGEGSKEVNKQKNRYTYIIPFDSNRVILSKIDNQEGSDYINASYIKGITSKAYIATQGPLPHTTYDFWRMVWEQKSSIILMLTKLIEDGRVKCHQYWPDMKDKEELKIYGNIRVEPIETNEENNLSLTIRKFKLSEIKDNSQKNDEQEEQVHYVTHFQYTKWPDHGVPSDIECLFQVIKKIDKLRLKSKIKTPMIVHCSAGIGRTGGFCTIHSTLALLRKHIRHNGVDVPYQFNIYETVLQMRKQRMGMVQQPEQYRFCYEAILFGARKYGMTFPSDKDKEKKGNKKLKDSKELKKDNSKNEIKDIKNEESTKGELKKEESKKNLNKEDSKKDLKNEETKQIKSSSSSNSNSSENE